MKTAFTRRLARSPASAAVESFWELRTDAGGGAHPVSPDGRCEMVVHLFAPPQRSLGAKATYGGASVLFGPINRALMVEDSGPSVARGVRFQYGGLRALGATPESLRNTGAHPREILGELGTLLEEAMLNAPDFEHFAAACERVIATALVHTSDPDLRKLLDAIECGALIRRDAVAAASGWTERHVTRLVRRETGHTPSELNRIARFHRARARVVGGASAFADIAVSCGYCDQAHMTHDFNRYASASPMQLRRDAGVYGAIYSPT